MTAPHPRAVGSYGPELLAWAHPRFGCHPKRTTGHRWWQQLTLTRLLEHDDAGDLVWRTVLLGTARQSGKSWGLRELALWRLEQADRFGEVQTIVHTAAKLTQALGVWGPAARWAARQPSTPKQAAPPGLFDLPDEGGDFIGGWAVRFGNGSESISRADGSSWVPQAANDQLGVSMSVSLAIVDEAWDVHRWIVDNGLVPTQAEANSGQLLLVSTAGRPRTGDVSDLYPSYRAAALAQVDDPRSTLILEWSADPDADPATVEAWRQASPHWDDRRLELLQTRWAEVGTSPAKLAAFRMQWLNQWPDLTDTARWIPSRLTAATDSPVGAPPDTAVAAVETSYTDPDSHAVVRAWADVEGRVLAQVTFTTSLADALIAAGTAQLWTHAAVVEAIGPTRWGVQSVTAAQARAATATLRDLVHSGRLTVAGMPDAQWAAVITSQADDGHHIDARKSGGDTHAVKALSWAVWAVQSGRSHSGFLFGDPAPDDEALSGVDPPTPTP